jgi:hypothetical protein
MSEQFVINFGKFKDRDISNILNENHSYFTWLKNSAMVHRQVGLSKFLETNLKEEVNDGIYRLPRGKYRGSTLEEVYKTDPKYWNYMLNNYGQNEELMKAIKEFTNA